GVERSGASPASSSDDRREGPVWSREEPTDPVTTDWVLARTAIVSPGLEGSRAEERRYHRDLDGAGAASGPCWRLGSAVSPRAWPRGETANARLNLVIVPPRRATRTTGDDARPACGSGTSEGGPEKGLELA